MIAALLSKDACFSVREYCALLAPALLTSLAVVINRKIAGKCTCAVVCNEICLQW